MSEPMESSGHDDESGKVFCHFCEWSKQCTRGIEEIEFELMKHLREAHDKPLLFRVDDDTGRKVDIPQ